MGTIATAPRPSESQHWYDRSGNPVYEVPRADGKGMRNATLADARKLGLVPGFSGIARCAEKPALAVWLQRQVLLAALTLPRIDGEQEDAYIARIMQDSKEQGRKAAERGTAIHAAIQGHYEGKPPTEDYWPYVKGAAAKIEEQFGKQEWIAEKSFAHPMGYGGKVDLHCRIAVIDVKSKEFDESVKKLAFDEHAMQLVAYRTGLGVEGICANVFVSANNPGLVKVHKWDEEDLEGAWYMFTGLLQYWKAKNKIETAFELAVAA